jgi:two-component system, LytTR family, sensor kinase
MRSPARFPSAVRSSRFADVTNTRLKFGIFWVGAFAALGLLTFAHYYLDVLVRGRTESPGIKLIEELTGSLGAGVFLLPVAWLTRHGRQAGWSPTRMAGAHALALPVYSILHTTWNWATRSILFPLAGLGAYDYGRMPVRYAMELPIDIVLYAFVIGSLYLFDRYLEGRERELRLARVETELGEARLEALEGRLHPHFLFNALNTISSVMYEDVAVADTMLSRLADLLRRTLRRPLGRDVSLAEELETLDMYLSIMRARFADRLRVNVQVDEEARTARVPPLVLQPLVENAIIHGDPGPDTSARIEVRARRDNGKLVLEVEDNGPGVPELPDQAAGRGRGIGLGTTSRRLAHLYGDRAGVTLENLPGGGVRAVVTLPFEASA